MCQLKGANKYYLHFLLHSEQKHADSDCPSAAEYASLYLFILEAQCNTEQQRQQALCKAGIKTYIK